MLKTRAKKSCDLAITADLEARLNYSARRKTLAIKVEGGKVTVQAPAYARRPDIEQFVRSKRQWIVRKVTEQCEMLSQRRKHWHSGETVRLLGREVVLRIAHGPKGSVTLCGDNLTVSVRRGADETTVQRLVEGWYRRYAGEYLARRVAHWQTVTGIRPQGQSVRSYKARWGSCNRRAEVQFNWKLIMAPPAVVDYVVVHELCHIVHFDHSPVYWRLVAQYQPDYRKHKRWLRRNGLLLEL